MTALSIALAAGLLYLALRAKRERARKRYGLPPSTKAWWIG